MSALAKADPEISDLIRREERRQHDWLRLIPSENYASAAVLEASASVLTNKYSEGYAGKRYYEGQRYIDQVEELAIARAKALFGAEHVNVQPYSGSPANLAVYFAFCKPGDTILGHALPHGGHLTHGWNVSITGSYFNAVQYTVRKEDHRIDMDEVQTLARKHRPRLLIAGATAYPRLIDYAAFAEIAKEVGSIFVVDMAHVAGLVAGGSHPSPIPLADVVTTTTHKTLRGPRGGMILCKMEHAKAIDRAVFPGLQGGPHNHTTAAIAVALKEAQAPEFKTYARAVVDNAKVLATELLKRNFDLISGGTDNHLLLLDLTKRGVTGKIAAKALDAAGIETNYNSIPYDPRKPFDPSGVRIGTPSLTSRGMGHAEMAALAGWMDEIVSNPADVALQARVLNEVQALCAHFPAPGIAIR